MHVGSVNELDNEQGLAHLVEHVRFLGSRKREDLLDLGTKSNAFTDFHHTVYHVHSPVTNPRTGAPMLKQVLEALAQVGFDDHFSSKRIAKERKAILAEAQMMNTIEYRMDCELLKKLHAENALGRRFPIGMVEQVEQWDEDLIKDFWQRWYQPSNATLYIVGDLPGADEVQQVIAEAFLPEPVEILNGNVNGNGNGSVSVTEKQWTDWTEDSVSGLRSRMPAVDHIMGVGEWIQQGMKIPNAAQTNGATILENANSIQTNQLGDQLIQTRSSSSFLDDSQPCQIDVFQHPLVPLFTMSVMAKMPIIPMQTIDDLAEFTKIQLIVLMFAFRVNKRYLEGGKYFAGIELDISNSAREACAVSTVTISAEPRDWKDAIDVAVEEARGMQKYGVTQAEFDAYLQAILRQTEVATQVEDSVESKELLEFLMDAIAMKHTFITNEANKEVMMKLAPTLTLQELKAACRSHLSFISHYGREEELWQDYLADPTQYGMVGPTRATTITVCMPAFVSESGHKIGGGGAANRGSGLSTGQHIDAESLDIHEVVKEIKAQQQSEEEEYFEAPEGAVKFNIQSSDLMEALKGKDLHESKIDDLYIPTEVFSQEEWQRMYEEVKPEFVPPSRSKDAEPFPPAEEHTGIQLRKLSNGVCLNFKYSDSEKSLASLRVSIPGGHLGDPVGKKGLGTMLVNCIREVPNFGDWSRSSFEMFCAQRMIQITALESDHECIFVDMNFWAEKDNFLDVAGLLNILLTKLKITQKAFERAKSILESNIRVLNTSLEDQSDQLVLGMMFGKDRRLLEMTVEDLQKISLEDVQEHMQRAFVPTNLEVSVVGDIDLKKVEQGILKYLGCIPVLDKEKVIKLRTQPLDLSKNAIKSFGSNIKVWHQKDQDERALARVCGKSFSSWGPYDLTIPMPLLKADITPPKLKLDNPTDHLEAAIADTIRKEHPFFTHATQYLLQQILNSRLFMVVRDQLNLSYDVKFEFKSLNQTRGGYFVVNVTSTAEKIKRTTEASIHVLQGLKQYKITWMELDRARQNILSRHRTDCQSHPYLLGLLQFLQADSVPYKTIECLRDLESVYESVTVADLNDAIEYVNIDDFYVCIATSGPQQPEDLISLSRPNVQEPKPKKSEWSTMMKGLNMEKLAKEFVKIAHNIQNM